MWAENETEIVNLGFHVGVDTGNYRKDYFEDHVRKHISLTTKTDIKKIPRFQCGFTSPFMYDQFDQRSVTKTYDIQCTQPNAKALIQLLERAYTNDPTFMFHKVRHTHPDIYRDAIRAQNSYLSSIRIVPIQGVTEDAMFYIDRNILSTGGVKSILHHRLTSTHGRWSIVVSAGRFETVKKEFRTHLAQWNATALYDNKIIPPQSFPETRLSFKNDDSDEALSDSGRSSYITACSTIYSVGTMDDKSDTHDEPPNDSLPVPQAWRINVPSVIATTSSLTPSEPPASAINERLQSENTQLRQQVHTLTDQVSKLTSRLDAFLVEIRSLTALNQSLQSGQPTATNSVNMSVDASLTSSIDGDL
jgi:hypothetical protein